ncbi:MAG TPA: hypothetical protein EYO97_09810 [Gemmatimonadetes bacterium]|nr:hypothetical protein [Gemmatimonadota bacterium]
MFVLTEGGRRHELAGEAVGELAADGRGGALAIVGGHCLYRRNSEGEWSCVATSELQLECSVAVGDVIYVGTEDAHLLRIHGSGEVERLAGFDAAPGRESCYAGSVLVDGQLLGPPLAMRSMTATSDGGVLLANVHVGGISRSTDGSETWQPTIDVESDVHEVRARTPHVRAS